MLEQKMLKFKELIKFKILKINFISLKYKYKKKIKKITHV